MLGLARLAFATGLAHSVLPIKKGHAEDGSEDQGTVVFAVLPTVHTDEVLAALCELEGHEFDPTRKPHSEEILAAARRSASERVDARGQRAWPPFTVE
jgi:hypothetical protein